MAGSAWTCFYFRGGDLWRCCFCLILTVTDYCFNVGGGDMHAFLIGDFR